MMKGFQKKVLPHVVAVALFVLATAVYFSPMFFDGKQLLQYDILQSNGSSQEVIEYRERTGNEALWTNSVFGGMPAYHISVMYHNNWLNYLQLFVTLGMPSPAYMIFLALAGFYIMLLCFKVNPWLAIAGAFAYGLSTYFILIAGAGHNTKMRAMAYLPPVIGGVYMAYVRGKVWPGVLTVCLALGLQIRTGHLQITYYTAIIIFIFMIFELLRTKREKLYADFAKTSAAMIIGLTLAVGVNITGMLLTAEYTPYSMRGQSELTDETGDQTRGLDRSYILDNYSYGISETMNMLIPSFAGGPISADAAKESELYDALVRSGALTGNDAVNFVRGVTYWGGMDGGTAGPVYLGAIVVFLFILGLFAVKGPVKWWLLTATILSIALAWGKHFGLLSNLFIDYFPMYNKFRTVSMILTIAMVTVPLLGILAVNELLSNRMNKYDKKKILKKSFYITGGITLFFALFSGMFFNFEAVSDANFPEWVTAPLSNTRKWALRSDAFRSFLFVTGAAAALWFTVQGKLKSAPAIALLTALIVVDLWTVDKRYLNDSAFKPKGVNIAQPSPVNVDIMQDKSLNYRVMNKSVSTFNDATTSFFHHSIGGYHGAKMKRYQELIEHHIRTGNENMAVLNMLNTKYFIVPDRETGQPVKQQNPAAVGNAWPVKEIRWVDSPDAEITALNNFDPEAEAVIDERYRQVLDGFAAQYDSTANIELTNSEPNHLIYAYNSQIPQLIVFSEIFYDAGWNAYIDGKPAQHVRANYVLRAMAVPAGKHDVVFKFEPANYTRGENIALASSIGIVLLILGVSVREFLRKK